VSSGRREEYCGDLRHINGDFPFTQPPLKMVELRLQAADKRRLLAGRGYDGRVVRLEDQLDVARGLGHVIDVETKEDTGDQSTLSYPFPHVSTR